MPRSRFATFLFRSLVTLGSCLLMAVLFEYYLRSAVTHIIKDDLDRSGGLVEANPELLIQYSARGRRFVPNAHVVIKNHYVSKEDVHIDINSFGLRSPEISKDKQPGEYRVMFLGDSVTVEDYLPDEKTFVRLTEAQLARSIPTRKIVAINSGIGNIGTEEEVNILEDTIETVKPDLIVVNFYLNDSRPPWGFSKEMGDRGWLRRHSVLVETIFMQMEERRWIETQGVDRFKWIPAAEKLAWKKSPDDLKRLAELARYDWGAAWDDSSWKAVDKQFARLQELAKTHHSKVAVVAFPVKFQVEAEYVDDGPQKNLKKLADSRGFAFYDLLTRLRQHASEDLFFDHCHPTAHGSKVIADDLAGYLLQIAHTP